MNLYKQIFKRVLDVCISIVVLIIFSPIILILSILIKLTSEGPVFFKQKRLGLNGENFFIYKFRTMCVGAENIGDGLTIKTASDNRITTIGGFLRKTGLDELPQLINVIIGDMSLIGPRPPVTYFPYDGFNAYPEWAKKRFAVRPGITGLAQCTVRNSVSWDKRIEIDLHYLEEISFTNDLKIIYKTILKVFKIQDIYDEGKITRDKE
ncbi:Undecaprenyl-phosphate galactosephosphotransferase [Enterococcus mundtii 3F]|uniref:sugar transferase n=1 Tax=Enterococcus mundtii TaxID=53346 RepID=UPI00230383A3|nr:sugar transferase [Enterococcus mundtii]MDA9461304.1 Undecaprenyl-phosphate galactosephosphotransferase [Enterococcus mundtii 3F]